MKDIPSLHHEKLFCCFSPNNLLNDEMSGEFG